MPQYDVFISHAHRDWESGVVPKIFKHLKRKGLECFVDEEGIIAGKRYRIVEENAVENSQKVLLVFSRNCYDGERLREEIMIELAYANKHSKTIIPFVIDKTPFNSSIIQFLGEGDEGTSAIIVKAKAHCHYPQLLKAILEGITPINYIRDEHITTFSLTQQNANEGKSDAQVQMGDYFRFGKSLEVDYNKAIQWYEKAAKQHDEQAYSKLGECYLSEILPFLHSYRGVVLDLNFFQRIPDITIKAKKAEKWFRLAALAHNPSLSGLFALFEENIWSYCNIFQLLPDNETFNIFEGIDPTPDYSDSYRLCHLMYQFTNINGLQFKGPEETCFVEDTNPDDWKVAPEVIEASQRAIRILQKWSDVGNINAILFLASVYLHITFENNPVFYNDYHDSCIQKTVELINKAYRIAGVDILRYCFQEYYLCDDIDGEDSLSSALLGQDNPNPIGMQLAMKHSPNTMDEWENRVKVFCWDQAEQLFLLGMAALRVNLSFAAKWLIMSTKIGEPRAKQVLADFYAESLVLYKRGEETHTGAINNIYDQVEQGASSGDDRLDTLLESFRKDGVSIRQIARVYLVYIFKRNISEAFKMYMDINDRFKIGRCYYWGAGTLKNKELAARFGYDDCSATGESKEFLKWMDALEEDERLEQEAQLRIEGQRYAEEHGYYDDMEVIPSNSPVDESVINDYFRNKREECNRKAMAWKSQFPGLPCPYDYIVNEYQDL